MKLPFLVKEVGEQYRQSWNERFSVEDNWDRSVRENIWRRFQDPRNREFSGWTGPDDLRRRILHFRDKYDFVDGKLLIESCYFYFNIKNERQHVEEYLDVISQKLSAGGWSYTEDNCYERDDLLCSFVFRDRNPYDDVLDIPCRQDYADLEMVVRSQNFVPTTDIKHRPWHLLKVSGIRPQLPDGKPAVGGIEDILRYLPAQVELGCGPSIEARIPALNYLHEVYGICKPDKKFVFEAADDKFLDFLVSPEKKYAEASYMHLACLLAEPNQFYHDLKWLHEAGHVVGDILTNNFDGLTTSVRLPHFLMRAFDTVGSYPKVDFHPEAKSLIVFGCHADRRTSQNQARKRGLKVIYVDPQGYETEDGFYRWPIETPQDGDLIIELKAGEAMAKLVNLLRNP